MLYLSYFRADAGKHPEKLAELLELINRARVPNERFPMPGLDAKNR